MQSKRKKNETEDLYTYTDLKRLRVESEIKWRFKAHTQSDRRVEYLESDKNETGERICLKSWPRNNGKCRKNKSVNPVTL